MSALDNFDKARNIYNSVKENLNQAMGLTARGDCNDSNNDKSSLFLHYTGKHCSQWNDANVTIHASHGYYGSSSGYSDMTESVARYLTQALNNYIKAAAKDAIELAKKDMEQAAEHAKHEAESVLKIINKQSAFLTRKDYDND